MQRQRRSWTTSPPDVGKSSAYELNICGNCDISYKMCDLFFFRNAVSLKERLSYLARAIMCMRSDKIGYAPYLGTFLRDLEDKMEVAKVQEQILDTIVNMQNQILNSQEAIITLNSELFEITQVGVFLIFILTLNIFVSYM